EKRGRDEDLEDVSSRKNPKLDATGGSAAGLHRLTPGQPAGDFIIPPAFGHTPLFDGQTKVVVSDAERIILEDMGPDSIRNEIASSSAAIFRLLEVVTFLNGRECQYLKERDAAMKKVTELGQQLWEMTAAFDDYK
ncbi:hypothetical protein A2U01_0056885, partial [Trifolium medium]|nr:hypothetical protein [Trifolium medium]